MSTLSSIQPTGTARERGSPDVQRWFVGQVLSTVIVPSPQMKPTNRRLRAEQRHVT